MAVDKLTGCASNKGALILLPPLLQVRATLFGPVVHGLSECAALRYICPDDPLWQQAAAGLTSVIQAGLPAVNIMFVNSAQQPANAWQVLADAFETFLLGEGLPEGLLPSAQEQQQQQQSQKAGDGAGEVQHSGGGGAVAAAADGAAAAAEEAAALQTAVLDVLTEQVLASCSSAAYEQRSRLVRVLMVGAGSTAGHACLVGSGTGGADAGVHAAAAGDRIAAAAATDAPSCRCPAADQRFSQMCLRRLAMLASRGTDGQAGSLNAVLLEVAQIALPQLLQRCRAVLQAYCRVEQAAIALELQQLQRQVQAQQQHQGQGLQLQRQVQAQQQHQGQGLQQQQQQQQQQGEGAAGADPLVPLVCQAECTVVAVVQQVQQQQAEEAGSGEQAQVLQLQQRCLVDEVLCVLHVLLDLQIDVAVFEHLLGQEPSLAACLAAVQHAQVVQAQLQQQQQQQPVGPQQAGAGQSLQQQLPGSSGVQQQKQLQSAAAAEVQRRYSSTSQGGASEQGDGEGSSSSRHQGHLLLLYRQLADCAGCRDRRVGVLVRAALQAAGQQLAL
jgi:hypothetical protein